MFETSFIQLFSTRVATGPRVEGAATTGEGESWQRTLNEAAAEDAALDAEAGRRQPGEAQRSGPTEGTPTRGDVVDLPVISDNRESSAAESVADATLLPERVAVRPVVLPAIERAPVVLRAETADAPATPPEPAPRIVPAEKIHTRVPETEVADGPPAATRAEAASPRRTIVTEPRVDGETLPETSAPRGSTGLEAVPKATPATRPGQVLDGGKTTTPAETPGPPAASAGITEGADPVPTDRDTWRSASTSRPDPQAPRIVEGRDTSETPRLDVPRATETASRTAAEPAVEPVRSKESQGTDPRPIHETKQPAEVIESPKNTARFDTADRVPRQAAPDDGEQVEAQRIDAAPAVREQAPARPHRTDVRPQSPEPTRIETTSGAEPERSDAVPAARQPAPRPAESPDLVGSPRPPEPVAHQTTHTRTGTDPESTSGAERARPERPYVEATVEQIERQGETRTPEHRTVVVETGRSAAGDRPSAAAVSATLHETRKMVDPATTRGARSHRSVHTPAEDQDAAEARPVTEARPPRPYRLDAPAREREPEGRPVETEPRLDIREGELRQDRPNADWRPRRGAGTRAGHADAPASRVAATQTDVSSAVEAVGGPRGMSPVEGSQSMDAPARIHHRGLAESIVARARSLPANGSIEIRFALEPRDLGPVRVRIESRGDQLKIRIVASSGTAADTLYAGLARLTAQLDDAGIKDAQIDLGFEDALNSGTEQRDGGPEWKRRGGNAAAAGPDSPRSEITARARTGSRSKLDRIA